MVVILGAYGEISARDEFIEAFISPRIWSRPSRAWLSAFIMISSEIPAILVSSWKAVMPSAVPVTLKSMSPRWSSAPRMSERTATFSSSMIRPMAIPATGLGTGTPASIRASEPPHTDAMELEPLDSRISLTMRIVYGKSSFAGIMGRMARSARAP